jgi:hypothetical protein
LPENANTAPVFAPSDASPIAPTTMSGDPLPSKSAPPATEVPIRIPALAPRCAPSTEPSAPEKSRAMPAFVPFVDDCGVATRKSVCPS